MLQVPHAGAESKILVRQRAHRTDIHDVTGVRILQPPTRKQIDLTVVAALEDAELTGFRHLVEKARAAGAQDTALLIEHDQWSDVDRLALLDLRLERHTARLAVVIHVVILQFALTRLVADRAIHGMIHEQELENRRLGGLHPLGLGAHDHPFGCARVTGDLQLGHLLDFDETHATVARHGQPGMEAIVRHLDTDCLRRLDEVETVFDRDGLSVDL
jgi:hypothetical protein